MRGRPTRHGFVVAARRRTSACAQMDGDAWRCQEASGGHQERGEGWGAARARPVASGLGVRCRQGREREEKRE